ncbi:MAG: hypothetical protein ACREOJ_02815, partial [Gemmatimonadaceae bacterium]
MGSALAPAWRAARRNAIPAGWSLDGIPISDLQIQNRVPSRFSRPLSYIGRVETALNGEISRTKPGPTLLLAQFALPYGPAVQVAAATHALPYAVHLRGDDVWIWPHQSEENLTAFRGVVRQAALVLGVSRAIVNEA